MKVPIRFEHVSKRYRLGAWRASLREAFSFSSFSRRNDRLGSESERKFLWALRDVNFEVPKGHALGVVGPNGGGKTTILKLLSKITRPTSGRIEVSGRVSSLIELGAGFHPELTGRDNVYLNGAILGMRRKEIDRLFDVIVSFSGLERFIDTPVKRYSSGMYVRLGFSVAAHVQPDVLLVDEVLAVGDAKFRQRCVKRLEQLRESGTTIVFVAHNLFLVKSICDQAIFLKNGEMSAYGDVTKTIRAYDKWIQESAKLQPFGIQVPGGKSEALEIETVSVAGWGSRDEGIFAYSSRIEIRVYFRARETIGDPNLILRIIRTDGLTCSMIRTKDYGYSLDELSGHGVISLVVDPVQLHSGSYFVEARIAGKIDGVPIAWAHSECFRVDGVGISGSMNDGVFVPKVTRAQVLKRRPSEIAPSEASRGHSAK